MVYLLGVVGVARRFGRGPAIWASVLSVGAFDFFFVAPSHTFAVSDVQYLVTFAVMLLVALVISTLTVRLRQQAEAARQRERRTAALYAMSRDLASMRGTDDLLWVAARHISEVFESQVVLLLPDAGGHLQAWEGGVGQRESHATGQQRFGLDDRERAVAQWVYDHQQMAGLGTATLPSARALYVPLIASRGTVGVLGVQPAQPRHLLAPEQVHLLETSASQTALALERASLAEAAQRAQVQIETERLRSSLLSSVSHDLRTPLAAITGAASSLLEGDARLATSTRRELLQAIYEETHRLNRLVNDLLEMTRLESGAVQVHKEWQSLAEVVRQVLTHLEARLHDHPLTTNIPTDLPPVPFDDVLIEQVLINLLDNAIKYTPPGSPLEFSAWCTDALSAWLTDNAIVVELADRGPGLPPGDEQRIFEKFYRVQRAGEEKPAGFGLGLPICRAIVEAHGGRIWAENRPGGGAIFRFTLPFGGTPPQGTLETETTADHQLASSAC
jgi:two-component system sensor histidine kinase KdpD